MYRVDYVTSHESVQPTHKETSVANDLATVIASARQKIKNANLAASPGQEPQCPIGFLIYDSASGELLHKEYLG
jgi:hypothetical protein